MKVHRINLSRNLTRRILKSNKKTSTNALIGALPVVTTPVVAYMLMTEKEAKAYYVENYLNRNSGRLYRNETGNMELIAELENKKIIEPQLIWQAPRFDNCILTDSGYKDVKEQILAANISDSDKQKYIDQLKVYNYRTTFGQAPTEIENTENTKFESNETWQTPKFMDDNTLPDSEYKTIKEQIEASNLSDYEKQEYLAQLKMNNYKNLFEQIPQASAYPEGMSLDPVEHLSMDIPEPEFAEIEGLSFADVPLLESVYGLSLLIKAKDPLVDLKNGRFKDAGIKTGVRAIDTFLLLPFKHGRALVGGLKGTWLSIRGIESKQTGFIKGYKDGLRKWVKGRRMVEEYAINPDKFDEPTSAETYEAQKQAEAAAIAEWQTKVAAKSNEIGAKLNEWCERNIAYHEFMRNNFSDIISNENQRSEFYATQLDNIIQNSALDVQTIQKDLELMQNEQQQLEIMYNQYIENLKNSLAGLNDDNLISQKIENMSADIKKYYETRQKVLATEIAKINNLLFINNKSQNKKSLKGMDKLAGYSDIKSNLRQIFVNPIKKLNAGINAEIPNMILLYGPKGCGKSMMANAVEEETGCNIINIDISLDTEIDKKALENAIQSSKDNYDNTGTHTIIRIEEIDNFLSNVKLNNSLINDFNSLAKNKHCTIIATTNHPLEINNELLPKNDLSTIYVSPANKEDIVEIFKYYASDFADKTVDYEELAQQILDIAYDDAYSNAQIGGLIQNGVKMRFLQNGKLSQQDFIEILNESYPDIKEKVLKSYITKGGI